jgi:hypothetical protein
MRNKWKFSFYYFQKVCCTSLDRLTMHVLLITLIQHALSVRQLSSNRPMVVIKAKLFISWAISFFVFIKCYFYYFYKCTAKIDENNVFQRPKILFVNAWDIPVNERIATGETFVFKVNPDFLPVVVRLVTGMLPVFTNKIFFLRTKKHLCM